LFRHDQRHFVLRIGWAIGDWEYQISVNFKEPAAVTALNEIY
jgi:hypothetical protein